MQQTTVRIGRRCGRTVETHPLGRCRNDDAGLDQIAETADGRIDVLRIDYDLLFVEGDMSVALVRVATGAGGFGHRCGRVVGDAEHADASIVRRVVFGEVLFVMDGGI